MHNIRYDETICIFENAAGAGMKSSSSVKTPFVHEALNTGTACTAIAFTTGQWLLEKSFRVMFSIYI